MQTWLKFLSVAAGGALGATARYAINLLLAEKFPAFPTATFLINVSGSFLIGFLLIIFTEKIAAENLRLAVLVGFLGAYTTFSTFELELFNLTRERAWMTAFVYLTASIIAGFLGVFAGMKLARMF